MTKQTEEQKLHDNKNDNNKTSTALQSLRLKHDYRPACLLDMRGASPSQPSRSLLSIIVTLLPRTTTMPMLFFSPVFLCSMASSMTRFMNGSKPRITPETTRLPLILIV